MADRKSVRAELERKRVQLAQMRQERERRSRMHQEDENTSQNSENRERIEDADAVLQALGLTASLSRVSTAPSTLMTDQTRSDGSSLNNSLVSPLLPQQRQNQSIQAQLSTSLNDSYVMQSTPRVSVPLQVVHVNQINIPPKERLYYTKSTQTHAPIVPPAQLDQTGTTPADAPQQKSYYVLTYQDDEDEQSSDFNNIPSGRQSKSTATGPGLPQVEMVRPAGGKADDLENVGKQSSASVIEMRELNAEERKQVELREDYQQFIDRATKILERALCHNESPEIFIQYFPDGGRDAIDDDRRSGNQLSLNRIFSDDKWSRNRCVTGFDWSVQYPELLLASYFVNDQAPSDPDGALLVWNMKFKNTSPEYIFHCQSPIMSCCFAKFHPSLIVGGTYSGQIVLWDMRSNKKTPVQRSPLTAAAHTHPVYCAKVVGTQNAHNLISVSTDGKLCSWSLDMLSAPQETMELNQQKQTRSVAVTCMSFHPDDYNNFLVGSEEGAIYSACRHGSRTGILNNFESHQGLVTSVDFRPIDTQSGYSHLFLSSSIDWTVKLWDTKESEPIHSFESNSDYVYDVKWSPNNPALFATADGDGRVDLWNLAQDSELPTASTHVEPIANADPSKAHPSLNKLIWTPNGNQVVVGDDVGRIHVYDIGDVGDLGRRQEEKWKLRDHISSSKI